MHALQEVDGLLAGAVLLMWNKWWQNFYQIQNRLFFMIYFHSVCTHLYIY
jgi:hypothetical protein